MAAPAILGRLLPRHDVHRRQGGVEHAIDIGIKDMAGGGGILRAIAGARADTGIGNDEIKPAGLGDPIGHHFRVPDIDHPGQHGSAEITAGLGGGFQPRRVAPGDMKGHARGRASPGQRVTQSG